MRNVQYFDWNATAWPLLVLAAWAVAGLMLGLLGERLGPHVRILPPARRRSGGRGGFVNDERKTAMKVFVAGASGAIGRRLVPLLAASGYDVVAMTHRPAKAHALRQVGVEPWWPTAWTATR